MHSCLVDPTTGRSLSGCYLASYKKSWKSTDYKEMKPFIHLSARNNSTVEDLSLPRGIKTFWHTCWHFTNLLNALYWQWHLVDIYNNNTCSFRYKFGSSDYFRHLIEHRLSVMHSICQIAPVLSNSLPLATTTTIKIGKILLIDFWWIL